MHSNTLRACNWSGVLFILLWLVGFLFLARVVPPPSPDESAEQIAQFYRDNTFGIRVGLLLTLFASPLYASWSAVIAARMKAMRGVHPLLADLQLLLGGLTVLIFMIPALLLEIAAFRPDRDPGIIQALNDIPWMMFVGMGAPAILQPFVIGVAILQQKGGGEPVLPRWLGYLNIWTAVLFLPGPLCVFFKTGPLAWDGVFTWWIPFLVFSMWMLVMIPVLARSISRDHDAPTSFGQLDHDLRLEIIALVDARLDAARHDDSARARIADPR